MICWFKEFSEIFTNMTIATDSPDYFRQSSLTQKEITQYLNALPHTRPANIECVITNREQVVPLNHDKIVDYFLNRVS